jgi:hypothetical protein
MTVLPVRSPRLAPASRVQSIGNDWACQVQPYGVELKHMLYPPTCVARVGVEAPVEGAGDAVVPEPLCDELLPHKVA